jgi:hypothetical protein
MIRFVALLALLFPLFASAQTWALVRSKHPSLDREIVFRYQKEFIAGFERSAYPFRVIVMWKHQSESGMPSVQERQRMDELEDILKPGVEAEGLATLVLISTGENLKEWIFYAKSEEEFMKNLNGALRGQPRFPIQLTASPDPAWQTYEKFRSSVRE